MPIKKDKAKGHEADGSLSDKWCAMCYVGGKFVDDNATMEEMQAIVNEALKVQHWPKFMRKLAVKQITTLERWQ